MAEHDPPTRGAWTLPNLLSGLRLLGVPLFLWLVLVPEADGWALAVIFVSGVSDYADGYLARKLNQTSKVGEILDPVADRLYILSTVIGLAARGIIPWWLALALPARDADGLDLLDGVREPVDHHVQAGREQVLVEGGR